MNFELKDLPMLKDEREHCYRQFEKYQMDLNEYDCQIARLEHLPEANVFDDMDEAEGEIEAKLLAEVYDTPHGECGHSKYTCGFMVGDKKYIGTLEVEWNRHDKRFYYEDGTKFTYVEVVE